MSTVAAFYVLILMSALVALGGLVWAVFAWADSQDDAGPHPDDLWDLAARHLAHAAIYADNAARAADRGDYHTAAAAAASAARWSRRSARMARRAAEATR